MVVFLSTIQAHVISPRDWHDEPCRCNKGGSAARALSTEIFMDRDVATSACCPGLQGPSDATDLYMGSDMHEAWDECLFILKVL